jgi:trehalose transport system permease protein
VSASIDREARRLRVVFVAAPAVFMAAILLLPALDGIALSFDANGLSLANYRVLLGDLMFWRALANNLVVPLASLAIEFALGLGLALFLTSHRKPGALVEVAAILPFAIPEIVILTIARYILMPRGYLDGAFDVFSLRSPGWIRPGSSLALMSVIVVDAWHVTPIVMLVLMAGLETIPPEVYEAAKLDGADALATFRHITLPMLVPALVGALVLRGVDALRIFSTTLVVTGAEGVPVLSTYSYQMWTDAQEPHVAMAASVVLALVVTLTGVAGLAIARRFGGGEMR